MWLHNLSEKKVDGNGSFSGRVISEVFFLERVKSIPLKIATYLFSSSTNPKDLVGKKQSTSRNFL